MKRFRLVVGLLLTAYWAPLSFSQPPSESASPAYLEELEHTDKLSLGGDPASIIIWNRTIVTFRTTVRGRSPQQRVEQTIKRFQQVSDFDAFHDFGSEPFTYEGVEAIYFNIKGHSLFTLFETDIDPASGQTLEQAAEQVVTNLGELQKAFRDQKRPELVLKGIVSTVLATGLLLFLIFILRKFSSFIRKWLIQKTYKVSWMKWKGFDIRQYAFVALRQLITVTFLALQLILGYLWLGYALGRFPFTRPVATVIGEHFQTAFLHLVESVLTAIPNLLVVLIIFYVTRGVVRLASGLSDTMENTADNDDETWLSKDTAKATRRIIAGLIWITGIMVAYPYIPGSGSEAFKGISVLLGLMLSLGSSGTVNQIMSGFVVLYSGGIRSGEYVILGEVEGEVLEIRLLSTRIRTPKNEFITVPNSVIIGKHSTNLSRHRGQVPTEVATSVTIGYDTPWRQVDAMLLKAVNATPGIRREPAPRVLKTELSDWYIRYELRFIPGKLEKKNQLLSDLHVNILDTFNEYGVQIMSPHFIAQPEQDILVKTENQTPPPAENQA